MRKKRVKKQVKVISSPFVQPPQRLCIAIAKLFAFFAKKAATKSSEVEGENKASTTARPKLDSYKNTKYTQKATFAHGFAASSCRRGLQEGWDASCSRCAASDGRLYEAGRKTAAPLRRWLRPVLVPTN